MGEHPEEAASFLDSVMEKVAEKLPGHDSSSSDSDDEKSKKPEPSSVKRLFGREKPVQTLFGGAADVILSRMKQTSAGVLAGGSVMWLLFEWLGYYLLTLICHVLILRITILFVWSNVLAFINKMLHLFQDVASALRVQINRLFTVIRNAASGRDLKKFLMVVAGLWILSVIGLTLIYVGPFSDHFGQITRALISSPGFNDTVNDYCGFLLYQATSSIPELKAAMFIPGARHRVLNVMKKQVKQALVLLLVGSGENYNDVKAFVDLYVTDTV